MSNSSETFARKLLGSLSGRPKPRGSPEIAEMWESHRYGCLRQEFEGLWQRYGDKPFSLGKRTVRLVRSCCFSCNSNCEVLVFVDADTGEVIRVEGDPESPVTRGVLCSKGLASRQLIYNPQRLRAPMVGEKGSAETTWRLASWDEALGIISERINYYRDTYGPESVAFIQGTRRGWSREFTRLAYAFGSPTHGAAGWAQCLWPRLVDGKVTFGGACMESPDLRNTRCMLIWGTNPPMTWPVRAADIADARARGASMIVVDPLFSETASKADIWLQLRPGTDSALALGMINVIIGEELYDREFVSQWTVGFEDLARAAQEFTPERVSKITGIPAARIQEAARLYAETRPACIVRCVALDETSDPVQACRAVSALCAITGNVDVPGGNVFPSSRGDRGRDTHEFIGYGWLSQEKRAMTPGYQKYPLLTQELSPVPSAHMPTLWKTIIDQRPYQVKAALIFGTNVVQSHANSRMVIEALKKLEFVVVCDIFFTATAEYADVVLPASTWLERDNVTSSFQCCPDHTLAQVKAVHVEGPKSDIEIVIELAKRLGLSNRFWESERHFLDYLVEPMGMTFEEFSRVKRVFKPVEYRKYLRRGFATPSGKVELRASLLERYGASPVPMFTEPLVSPERDPELARQYPLVLTTGRRVQAFRHSEHRQVPWLKELQPKPVLQMNPVDAERLGIAEGELVVVETPTGSAFAYAQIEPGIGPGVVQAMPGWAGKFNINQVIQNQLCAADIGTTPLRGLLCRVRKADEASVTRSGAEGGDDNVR
ncbi:MAG TPA: molybdopterin-dependent oxidoreductase [Firmicutes bacterium]|nr:molybdopterin-dependent oxidoreductase [Candidatus Fermentithermobacillaceae bacterium]